MRPLEIIFVLVNLPAAGWMLFSVPPPAWVKVLAGLAVVAAMIQWPVNGYRWQMLPAYCVTAGLFLLLVWPGSIHIGGFAGVLSLGCLAAAAALSAVLPVFELPTPSGAFPVGTVTLHLTDSTRSETFSDDPRARREVMVQIWYPAVAGGPGAAYVPRSATNLKTSHLALVHTHAVESAAVSRKNAAYPVLIFCPSWNGGKAQNTFQAEELASNGFIIAGIDHPYGANVTVFPDGRVVHTKLQTWLDLSSDKALEQSTRTAEDQLRIRSQDALFVLDALRRINDNDPVNLQKGKVDMDRVGVFGHSFGGAVAAQACWLDKRFRAGINMDGLMFGDVADAGVKQPFFFMNDDSPAPTPAGLASSNPRGRRSATLIQRDIRRMEESLARYGGYEMSIRGAYHMNFSDSPLFCRWKRFTGAGPIRPSRAMRIINDYTVAFFQQHLNGIHQSLLDGPSPEYPDVRFRNRLRP
jgi:dienelactone hydrolase